MGGEERFKHIPPRIIKTTDFFLMIYDITNGDSFDFIFHKIEENKIGFEGHKRKVTEEEAISLCNENKII